MRNYDFLIATKTLNPELKILIPYNAHQFVTVTNIIFDYDKSIIYLNNTTNLPPYRLATLINKLQAFPKQTPMYYVSKQKLHRIWGYRIIIDNNLFILN